jgi:kynurenine formamidase
MLKNDRQKDTVFSTLNGYTLIDLTHTLSSEIPTWSGTCGFRVTVEVDYNQNASHTKFRVQSLEMRAGIGTHLDAPLHCFPNALSVATIPLEQLIVPCVVIDVSSKVDPDYYVSVEDIHTFEKQHGSISAHSFVIGYTGWSHYWHKPVRYRNQDGQGRMHFPGFSQEAAELLLERTITGIGIDTLSPDGSDQTYFPVHNTLLRNGAYIVENLTNCHKLPPIGAYFIGLPLKIEGGTESPMRAVAIYK